MSLFGRMEQAERLDMGELSLERQSPLSQGQAVFRPLVAFDFDGTLTWRDTFQGFLAWRAGARRYATGLARLTGAAGAYLADRDRGRLKAAAVREFLAGASRS